MARTSCVRARVAAPARGKARARRRAPIRRIRMSTTHRRKPPPPIRIRAMSRPRRMTRPRRKLPRLERVPGMETAKVWPMQVRPGSRAKALARLRTRRKPVSLPAAQQPSRKRLAQMAKRERRPVKEPAMASRRRPTAARGPTVPLPPSRPRTGRKAAQARQENLPPTARTLHRPILRVRRATDRAGRAMARADPVVREAPISTASIGPGRAVLHPPSRRCSRSSRRSTPIGQVGACAPPARAMAGMAGVDPERRERCGWAMRPPA